MSQFYRDYQYLNYQTKDVLSCKRLEEIVLGNKYIQHMDKQTPEYQLLIQALNTGAFSKFSQTSKGYLYWLPSCNSGVPIVPRDSYLHETKFMLHDVYHQLLPDIIVDSFDPKYEKIYVYYRVLSEVFTMVLADYLLMDNFKKQGLFSKEELEELNDKKIYKTFKKEYEGTQTTLRGIFYKHSLFSLTGEFNYSHPHKNFEPWANNVYVADFLWSIINYYEIINKGTNYLSWAKEFKDISLHDDDYKRFNFLTDFENLLDKKDEDIIDALFEFIYDNYYKKDSNLECKLLPLEERVNKANKVIKSFNLLGHYLSDEKEGIDCSFAVNEELYENRIIPHFQPKMVAYYPKTNSLVKENFEKYKRKFVKKVGLYSASFDVVHAGHLNIITESSFLVDELIVGVATKEDKNYLFTIEERINLLKKEIEKLNLKNVTVQEVQPDIPRFLNKNHITYFFRGVRNVEDFENEYSRLYEFQKINNHFKEVLLFGDSKYHQHSSTKVKNLVKGTQDVSNYISEEMKQELSKK